MTAATQALGSSDKSSSPNLGRFGSFGRGVTPEQAKDIEALGYGAVWVGGSPRLKELFGAGADHVPVQVLTGPDKLVPALAELAWPLGLQ